MNVINVECVLMPHAENVMKNWLNNTLEIENGSVQIKMSKWIWNI